jgi:hypothetical protein
VTDAPRTSSTTRSGLHRIQSEARLHSSRSLEAYRPVQASRSGTMPDASGRVMCPHCRKLYPFSPAVLDRQVRCSGCRGVFTTAVDRRTFKAAPPPAPIPEQVGTASHQARAALGKASNDLKSLAQQALEAISDKERSHPRPGSGSTPDIGTLTARLARRSAGEPVLTGSGERRGRSWVPWTLVAAGAVVVVLVLLLAVGEDPRREALRAFQASPAVGADPANRILAMRRRSWSPWAVEPVAGIEQAFLGPVIPVDLSAAFAPLAGMRPLVRGRLWVAADRAGEAEGLLAQMPIELPEQQAAALARLAKAGIPSLGWSDALDAIDRLTPEDLNGLGSRLLGAAPPRGSLVDPLDLIGQGAAPRAAEVSTFEGPGQLILREGSFRMVHCRGRLVRFIGEGWPEDWAVLDLQVVAADGDPEP